MPNAHHDIWKGAIVGYGNVSSLHGSRFKRPDDVDYEPAKKATAKPKGKSSQSRRDNSAIAKEIKARRKAEHECRNIQQQLDKANREKEKKAAAMERLRYFQTCFIRLTLSLSTHKGTASDFFDLVAQYPFDDEFDVSRDIASIAVKKERSKLVLRAEVDENGVLALGIFGGGNYALHLAKAEPVETILGTSWVIVDIW